MRNLSVAMPVSHAKQVLRVPWSGLLPNPGDWLMSATGHQAYRIEAVQPILAGDDASPRLSLLVTAQDVATGLHKGMVVHAWQRTRPNLVARAAPVSDAILSPALQSIPGFPALDATIMPQLSVDQRSMAARERRLASEQAPPAKAQAASWDCPTDTANTRSPKQVRGHRRADVLAHMKAVGCDVTMDNLVAARMFQCDYDIAELGLSSGDPLQDNVGRTPPGPKLGPTRNQTIRAAKEREVARCLRVIGKDGTPLLLHVLIGNRDVTAWCRMEPNKRLDRKVVMGGFLVMLRRLTEFYGVQTDRERSNTARREVVAA